MISFIIDFGKSDDAQRFINLVNEYDIIISCKVENWQLGVIVHFDLICHSFSDALTLLKVIDNLLTSLKIDARPFSFDYSECLD